MNFEENHFQVGPGDEVDWLRSDMEESPVIAVKKKSLVNKLDDLARREFCLFVFCLSSTCWTISVDVSSN